MHQNPHSTVSTSGGRHILILCFSETTQNTQLQVQKYYQQNELNLLRVKTLSIQNGYRIVMTNVDAWAAFSSSRHPGAGQSNLQNVHSYEDISVDEKMILENTQDKSICI